MGSKKVDSADKLEVEYRTALTSGWGELRDAPEETSAGFGTSRTGDKTNIWAAVSGTVVKIIKLWVFFI